jgi:pyridoxal phosphate enzyme (YggS family)
MLEKILTELAPYQAKLVAVSKTKPTSQILEMYKQGHKIFGENRALELADKYASLPKDIEWHFIGHLQTNKVKYIAPFVSLIHAVDRYKLLKAINKEAQKAGRIIDCLIQFHIAEEESKYGFDLQEAEDMLNDPLLPTLQNIRLCGVMGMATFTDDEQQVRREFKQLSHYFTQLKTQYFSGLAHFREISMGMSGDYTVALEEGSTMVRIGTLIFGARD